MGYRLGIDLGTTFSAISYLNPKTGKPAMVKDFQGMTTIPSVLAFMEDGSILHGREAKEMAADGFGETVSFFKRNMGYSDMEMELAGKTYTPKMLSSILLKGLISDAEKYLKDTIEDVIITVPAYFTDVQRRETVEAGLEAGIKVKGVLNEPSAAAYAYGLHNCDEKTVLVYDLGGGTFDVSVARISKKEIKIIGTNGKHELGGKDWDTAIYNWMENQYFERFGEDMEETYELQAELMIKAETAKKMLTDLKQTKISFHYNGQKIILELDRSTFEELTSYQLDLTKQVIDELFSNINYTWKDIDEVILIGGSTKMPMVEQYITRELGKAPLKGINPDEAVAMGAAMKVSMEEFKVKKGTLSSDATDEVEQMNQENLKLSQEHQKVKQEYQKSGQQYKFLQMPELVECVAHSLGMVSINKEGTAYINDILIGKNSRIPTKRTQVRELAVAEGSDNQLEIYMLQGDSSPLECVICGKYVFDGIEYVPGGKTRLAITYRYNDNGMIDVEAMQQETGKVLPMRRENIPKDMSWLREVPRVTPKLKKKVTIYLALDLSGSMAQHLGKVVEIVNGFMHRMNYDEVKFSLVGVADEVQLLQPPTSNRLSIQRSFQKIVIGQLGYGNAAEPFESLLGFITDRNQVKEFQEETSMIIVLADGLWNDKAQRKAVEYAQRCIACGIQTIGLGFGTADEYFLQDISSMKDLSALKELEQLSESFSKIARVVEEDMMGLVKNS